MTTVNVSLPSQLRTDAQTLIDQGHYASFSDVVRTALRRLIREAQYDLWAMEVESAHNQGKATILENKKDIKKFVDSL